MINLKHVLESLFVRIVRDCECSFIFYNVHVTGSGFQKCTLVSVTLHTLQQRFLFYLSLSAEKHPACFVHDCSGIEHLSRNGLGFNVYF